MTDDQDSDYHALRSSIVMTMGFSSICTVCDALDVVSLAEVLLETPEG